MSTFATSTHPLFRFPSIGWVALVLGVTVGCNDNFPGKPNPANRPVPSNQVVNFDQLYARNCAGCHGADGKLGPAPPLNDPTFQAIVSEEDLIQVIHDGRPGTPMPAFAQASGGSLTAAQVVAIVDGLKEQWKADVASTAHLPTYTPNQPGEIAYVPGDAERGASVFARACADCHGENGKGGDSGGAIHDSAFLALISDQGLRRIIITGRPDLGMPTYAESDGRPSDFQPLTSTEIDDLVALLAQWRNADQAVEAAEN